MVTNIEITVEDATFFLDMINSVWGPNWKPNMYKQKPYYVLFKDKNSDDYKRFISVYNAMRNVLQEREQFVLNQIFGADIEGSKLESVGKMLGVSGRRVSSIRSEGERKIAKALLPIIEYKTII